MILHERYEMGEFLGEGGMGAVYRGVDRQRGAPVAIKLIRADVTDPAMIERFRREGEMLRQLDHPNIVKLLDMVQHDGTHYLVMEYMPGGALRAEMDGPLPVERVVDVGLDIADALTRAHRLGIIHRDIKPENVFLDATGRPKLADFGLARLGDASELSAAGMVVGTCHYLSPEACQSDPIDHRTDIWAFGVMLYELLAGVRPFAGDNMMAIITAILTERTPDLHVLRPDLPAALVDLVYRMLEKDPARRLPSVRLAGAELEVIASGTVGSATATHIIGPRFAAEVSARTRHNLPDGLTPFVGREPELSDVATLFSQQRLITVLGQGGMGKTRLAIEAARQALDGFPDGAWFVGLAAVDEPLGAVASALGYRFDSRDRQQQIIDYLRNKQALLILDNFEHLIEHARLVTTFLKAAPGLKVLVTSRERLRLRQEACYHLGGLDAESAVRLFVQAARRANPLLEIEELTVVERLCAALGGMPLAVLLAAAWADMLTVEEIAAEVEANLDLLQSDLQDLPTRHQSVRAVFQSAWSHLDETEQNVLGRMAVFQGGFTRTAAQQVTGASLRALATLTHKSFIYRDQTSGRYAMHALVGRFAEEQLAAEGLLDKARRDHLSYFVGLLNDCRPDIVGRENPPPPISIEVLTEREVDVLRLVAVGLSNQQIADELVITLSTVKSHANHIFAKLGVRNRTQAVIKGRSLGLIP